MKQAFFMVVLAALLGFSCGGPGPILLTPKNQAGTRSVVLPDYMALYAAAPEEPGTLPAAGDANDAGAPAPAPKRPAPEKIDLEIREKMFIGQINDVYMNPEDYLGKTIKLEGLFKVEQYVTEDKQYCFVLRYGPGCCGNDGSAGFEVSWGRPWAAGPGVMQTLPPGPAYPAVDAWVEAAGVLDTYEEDGYPYIFLNLFSLTEKETRGAEFVSQ